MPIFDASTLILLAKAELLTMLFGDRRLSLRIPPEVEKECCGSKKTLDAAMIQKAIDEARIEVVPVRNRGLVSKLQSDFSLGKGEAEAIALALATNDDWVAIDDRHGINACRLLGIAFTTAIGILVRGKGKGLLEQADALAKSAVLARFGRYKESIVAEARLQVEAKP